MSAIDPLYFTMGYVYGALLMFAAVFGIVCLFNRKELKPVNTLVKYTSLALALCASIVILAYAGELFSAYTSDSKYEMEAFKIRITGPYWWAYVLMMITTAAPALLWIPRVRISIWAFTLISLLGVSSLHIERLVIIITTLPRM